MGRRRPASQITKCVNELSGCPASHESRYQLLAPAPRGGTETVLIVDDEEAVRSLAQAALAKRGYRVKTAANGGEALLLCEQSSAPIHLMIMEAVHARYAGPESARGAGWVTVAAQSHHPRHAGQGPQTTPRQPRGRCGCPDC